MSDEPKTLGWSGTEDAAPQSFTVRDALYVIFRHKWMIAVFFFTVNALGYLAVKNLPDIYQSEAKLNFRSGPMHVTQDAEISLPQIDASGNLQAAIQNATEMIQSPVVIGQVVDRIGVDRILDLPRKSKPFPLSLLSRDKETDPNSRGSSEQPSQHRDDGGFQKHLFLLPRQHTGACF